MALVRWPWQARPNRTEQRSAAYSISDPVLAALMGGHANVSGQSVTEQTAVTLSAVWRSVSLISGAIAGLPLRTLQDDAQGRRERVSSWLDNPAGPDRAVPFEWVDLCGWHLLLHGNAYGQHVYSGAGTLVGLNWVHPLAVTPERDEARPGGKRFTVRLDDGTKRVFDGSSMTQIMGPSTDGVVGLSPIGAARHSLGTGLAGDKAAARMFANGALVSGLVTPDEDLSADEAKEIKASLRSKLFGEENTGDIAVINRKLSFQPWSLSASDAQFLESRAFQIEEVSRWFGAPPHLLSQTDKQTSWGTGVAEQNRGLARYTLRPWTSRIEQRLTRLLPPARIAEFDYAGFIQPSPEDEIGLLIEQMNAGLLTQNEARRVRNLPPLPGGDLPRIPAGSVPPTELVRKDVPDA